MGQIRTEAAKAAEVRYRAANREKINARKREEYARDPGAVLARSRARRGIVDPPTDSKIGPCEMPGCVNVGPLDCDHWHDGPKKGQVRGWLCRRCNIRMSAVDDREWLKNAEAYRGNNL